MVSGQLHVAAHAALMIIRVNADHFEPTGEPRAELPSAPVFNLKNSKELIAYTVK
jgi:hypothetical protein